MNRRGDEPKAAHRKRCRRIHEPGHAHALTFCCFRRQPFLSKDRSRRWTIESIEAARLRHGFHLWAYVLMPEHVHLLIWPPGESCDLGAILTSIKQPVARRAVRFVQSHAPEFLPRMADLQPNRKSAFRFWQRGGGFDRNLWSPRYIWETIDYLHANPVRRGLCLRPEEWPWSRTRDYSNLGPNMLSIDRDSLPDDPRR